ncbi:MAG: stalk domain-containing protein [Chitinophagales bacterium]
MGKRVLLIAVFVCLAGLFIFSPSIAKADDDPVLDSDILVSAPAADEVLTAGETYDITWHADTYHPGVRIFYSFDESDLWIPIVSNNKIRKEAGICQYSWELPSTITSTAQIRVELIDAKESYEGSWEPDKLVWPIEDVNQIHRYYNDSGVFAIKASTGNTKPNKPSDLAATLVYGDTIDLSWIDEASDETGFNILRKTLDDVSFTKIGSVNKNINSFHDIGLKPKTTYYYVVTAYNAEGSSRFSNCAVAATYDFPKPPTPSGLTATAVSNSEIDLIWKDSFINESSFKLERSLKQGENYSEIASLPANTTSYKDTGLAENTTYYYRVKAINGAGDSSYSPLASAKTMSINQPPAAPAPTMVMKFTVNQKQCDINGVFHRMNAAPVIKETRVLLPFRYVAAPLGASVDWNAKSKKVTISLKGTILELWVGKNTAKVNGVVKPIDSQNPAVTPVIVPPGSTMLPLRFIAENLGCDVNWDPVKKEATVTL